MLSDAFPHQIPTNKSQLSSCCLGKLTQDPKSTGVKCTTRGPTQKSTFEVGQVDRGMVLPCCTEVSAVSNSELRQHTEEMNELSIQKLSQAFGKAKWRIDQNDEVTEPAGGVCYEFSPQLSDVRPHCLVFQS